MMEEATQKTLISQGIRALWENWAIAVGAPSVLIILRQWVAPSVLPVVGFILTALIRYYLGYRRMTRPGSCTLLLHVMVKSLFVSSLIMTVICVFTTQGIYESFFGGGNERYPYIAILVLAPVTLFFCLGPYFKRANYSYCADCSARNGTAGERGYLGLIYSQEGNYQVRFMMRLSLFFTVIGFTYYIIFYISVNYNSPDKFFFVWLPVIFAAISLVYMATRYFTILMYYSNDALDKVVRGDSITELRYLIFDRERIYLAPERDVASDDDAGIRLDTPATVTFQHRQRISLAEARQFFDETTGLIGDDADIRFMYSNQIHGSNNVFHYIATVDSPEVVDSKDFGGSWYNMTQLHRLMNNDRLVPMLRAEIYRLYTITMACKTYDSTGRRLYKIKNYKPTFRVADIRNMDIDYSDNRWFGVARNNEDRPFFHLRRWWHNLTEHRQ